MQQIRAARGVFSNRDGIVAGACVLCSEKLSLSWFDWCRHLLQHTHEQPYFCTECQIGFDKPTDHRCSNESTINVFGSHANGGRLEGFLCKLCNYLQITDYRLLEHFSDEHTDGLYERDVERITLVPDVRPQEHIIQTGYAFIPAHQRFRCGVGNCLFHGRNFSEYTEHFNKTHKICKTFFCPHCKKIINRMQRETVPLDEIRQHVDLHSSHLYQCFYCTECGPSRDAIQTHLLDKHSDLVVKYWHNNRHKIGDNIEKCELIDVVFDCCVCGERVDSKTSAIDHFRSQHSGRQFNFRAMKFIKDTAPNLHVTCSVDDSTCYREVFGCGLCYEYFSDKAKWIDHFKDTHPQRLLVAKHKLKLMSVKFIDVTPDPMEYQRLMLFSCASCTQSNTEYKATIDECYDHWKNTHTRLNFKPFHFGVTALVACNYCDIVATFQDLETHVIEKHAEKPFVALKAFEFKKMCALCNYSGDAATATPAADDDFIEHFRNKHALALQANVCNPIPMRDLDLWQIQRIFAHKKLKCGYCDGIFETKMEYRGHHAKNHTKSEQMFHQIEDKKCVQLIGDCCHTQINPKLFFEHLAHHKHTLACNECLFDTNDAFAFVCHRVECHERTTTTVPQKYRNFLELRYWRSKMIFGNGLVLNQFNTHGTEYDRTVEFEEFLEHLLDDKLAKLTPKQAGAADGDIIVID